MAKTTRSERFKMDVMRQFADVHGIRYGLDIDADNLAVLIDQWHEDQGADYECSDCKLRILEDTRECPYCGDNIGEEDEGKKGKKGKKDKGASKVKDTGKQDASSKDKKGEGRTAKERALAKVKEHEIEVGRKELERQKKALQESYQRLCRECIDFQVEAWEIGNTLRKVLDDGLWRHGGYNNFTDFVDRETGMGKARAYDLIRVVREHSKKDFEEIGWTKLRMIDLFSGERGQKLLEAARKGRLTQNELKAMRKKKGSGSSGGGSGGQYKLTRLTKMMGKRKRADWCDTDTGKAVSASHPEGKRAAMIHLATDSPKIWIEVKQDGDVLRWILMSDQ